MFEMHIIVWNPEKSTYSMQKHQEYFLQEKDFGKTVFIPEFNCGKASDCDHWLLLQTGSTDGKQDGIAGWGMFAKIDGKIIPQSKFFIDRSKTEILSLKAIKANVPGIEFPSDAGENGLSIVRLDRKNAEPLAEYIMAKIVGSTDKAITPVSGNEINSLFQDFCWKMKDRARKESPINCFCCGNEIPREKYEEFFQTVNFSEAPDDYDPVNATAEDFFKLLYVDDLCEDCRQSNDFPDNPDDVTDEQWEKVGIIMNSSKK